MKLKESQLKQLLTSIPSITDEFPLKWEGEEGHAEIEAHEIECGQFLISADFGIHEIGMIDPGDHETEPSFHSQGRTFFDFNIQVIHNYKGYAYKITSDQHDSIAAILISKLK